MSDTPIHGAIRPAHLDAPLPRTDRQVAAGERCPRCHHTAPNAEGCARCSPDILGERLRYALEELSLWRRAAADIILRIVPAESTRAVGVDVGIPSSSLGGSSPGALRGVVNALIQAANGEVERLRELVARAAACLEANSDKAARREWAKSIREEAGIASAPIAAGHAEDGS